nr:hypothetical protein 1634Bnrm3_p020 [Cryptomonas sp.]
MNLEKNFFNCKMYCSLIYSYKIVNNSFRYVAILTLGSVLKTDINFLFFSNMFLKLFKLLKNICFYNKFKLEKNLGLVRFTCDFLFVIILKISSKILKINFSRLRNTIGIVKLVNSCILFSQEKLLFLDLLYKLIECGKKDINIEEMIEFSFFDQNTTDFFIENNQSFKIINIYGVNNLDILSKPSIKDLSVMRKADFELLFHIFRKGKNFRDSVNISKQLRNKEKLFLIFEESKKANKLEETLFNAESFELIEFVGFKNLFFNRNNTIGRTSYSFVNYVKKSLSPNLLCLKFSLLELANLNLIARFSQKRHTELSDSFHNIDLDIKKRILNAKSFPDKFYNTDIESSNLSYFFDSIEKFFLRLNSNDLWEISCLFFNKFSRCFVNLTNFYNLIKRKKLVLDVKYIFSFSVLVLFKTLMDLICITYNSGIFTAKYTNRDICFYEINNIKDSELLLSISFFYFSKFSKKFLYLVIEFLNFYVLNMFLFEENILIWKNLEYMIISFVAVTYKTIDHLSHVEYISWRRSFHQVFNCVFIKEKLLKYQLNIENISITNDLQLYIKTKIFEIFLLSASYIKLISNIKDRFWYLKKIWCFVKLLEMEFFFSYLKKDLTVFLPLSLGILVINCRNKIPTFFRNLQSISEKKLQRVCALSILLFTLIGSAKIEIIKLIITEYKKYEKMKASKMQRILFLERKKIESGNQINKNRLDTLNEYEIEQTFMASKKYLEIGIIGMSVLVLGDLTATQMIMRIYGYFLTSHNLEIRRITTLSIGLLFTSNPCTQSCDFLIRLTNDKDWKTIKNSVFSLGIIGAGTMNTRIQSTLKCLADYYSNKIENFHSKCVNQKYYFNRSVLTIRSLIFSIRIAQGLINSLVKGIFLSVYLNREILDYSKVAFLVGIIHGVSSSKFIGFNSVTVTIFLLDLLIKPNLFVTVNENFKIRTLRIKKKIELTKEKNVITPILLSNNDSFLVLDINK